jgi:hypothetical protein
VSRNCNKRKKEEEETQFIPQKAVTTNGCETLAFNTKREAQKQKEDETPVKQESFQ